jgi:hypothetical protein
MSPPVPRFVIVLPSCSEATNRLLLFHVQVTIGLTDANGQSAYAAAVRFYVFIRDFFETDHLFLSLRSPLLTVDPPPAFPPPEPLRRRLALLPRPRPFPPLPGSPFSLSLSEMSATDFFPSQHSSAAGTVSSVASRASSVAASASSKAASAGCVSFLSLSPRFETLLIFFWWYSSSAASAASSAAASAAPTSGATSLKVGGSLVGAAAAAVAFLA